MPRNIIVEELRQQPVEALEVEIAERKGKGHPDYIADISAEAVSRGLCRYYMEEFGSLLHHNVDKGLVVGGRASPVFGGGKVEEPIQIILAGRAINEVSKEGRKVSIPVEEIAVEKVKAALSRCFRFLDVNEHVIIKPIIRRGSTDLVKIFELGKEMPLANDTSFGVCFAPLSELERLVLETELYLNSPGLKKELPEVGEDVKVLGVRRGGTLSLTVSAAIISSLTPDLSHYISVKEEIRKKVADLAAKKTELPTEVYVNAADKEELGVVYLTVTGTSAEAGDDGNTGRSNRIHGLITPYRQMSLEAVAGKNPVNHVGKVYNILAKLIADRVYEEVNGVKEVYVKILSQIGKPIDQPLVASAQVLLEEGRSLQNVRGAIEAVVDDELDKVRRITDLVLKEEVTLF